MLLLIEDLHWADRSTRAALAFLGRSLQAERVLIVGTYRPDEMHRRHPLRPLLAELERNPRARRIALAPLTHAELTDQLADILGAPPEPELLERLWTRSGGNPLYCEELLAAGLDGRGAAPDTLRDALMLRVERLSERGAGAAAARGGRPAGRRSAAGRDQRARPAARCATALREAVEGHILIAGDDDRYRFRHALLREVVEDDLLPGERSALHLALARGLEARIDESAGAGADRRRRPPLRRRRRPAGGARRVRARRGGRRARVRARRGERAARSRAGALGPRARPGGASPAPTTSTC